MTQAQTMHAIAISTPGAPDVLTLVDWEKPVPASGEILIRIAAAGVNGPDLAQRRGQYDPPSGASPLPGLEVAGIVEMADGNSGFAIGERVMALTNGGGYAEYVSVPAGQVLPMPETWSFAEAAAFPETWFTVTQTLVMRAGLEKDMHVLIHGAAGGIGSAAIQAAAILGAKPIAVVSSDEKIPYCTKLGAIATINKTREDILERVHTLTQGKGVERVLDLLGGDMATINIKAAARGGHIVQVATLAGGKAEVPLYLLMAKELTLSGSTLRPQSPAIKAAIAAEIAQKFLPHLGAATRQKPELTLFPITAASDAHALMESRSHRGKIVLLTAFGQSRAQN